MNRSEFYAFLENALQIDFKSYGFDSFDDFFFALCVKNPRVFQIIVDFWSLKDFVESGNKLF